jgi:nicotinate-nucleotide adenylyltransferase
LSEVVHTERVGVLGGTFNPIHNGHLLLAQSAIDRFELSRILFVPSATPPHKGGANILSADHRFSMLSLALEGDIRFEASDLEIRRGGCSYTIDTIRHLKRTQPNTHLYFIAGIDSLLELWMWKEAEELLKLCEFVSFERPGLSAGRPQPEQIKLPPPWPERLLAGAFRGRLIEISSSDIRYRVAEGLSIKYLVPSAVEIYIAEHGLYRGHTRT